MSLRELQSLHLRMVSILIAYASLKCELTAGDAYRDPRAFGVLGEEGCAGYGNDRSNHKLRLAHDFNLFVDGEYMTSSEDFRALGRFWEMMDHRNRWGGRYADGNHFETVDGHDNRGDELL